MTAVGKNDLQTQQAYSGQLRIQMAAVSCFTQFSHWMTCVPGHVIYSCIFLYAGWVFIIISQLVLTLWLVNLMGSTLLYGWLKFKVVFVAKLFGGLLPSVLNFYSK